MPPTPRTARRKVLEGVPRIGFWPDVRSLPDWTGGPEDFIWPSVLRACTSFLGRPYDYPYTITTTGAAFFLNWKDGWHGDNVATYHAANDAAATFVHGFDAVGYGHEIYCGRNFREHEADMRARIIESIDRGVPAVSHGIIGPPEASIITGYDEGGDVLIGWSYFQYGAKDDPDVDFEPGGYFRRRNWFEHTYDLLLFTGKREDPAFDDVLVNTLAWALEIVRTPVTWKDRHNGLAAYDAWRRHVLDDTAVSDGGPDDPFVVHNDAVGVVAEGRWYASRFLADAAGKAPMMAPHLLAAAACYADEHDLMWRTWGCVGSYGRGEVERKAFRDPSVRRGIADHILRARERDAEAASHLEAALRAGVGHQTKRDPASPGA